MNVWDGRMFSVGFVAGSLVRLRALRSWLRSRVCSFQDHFVDDGWGMRFVGGRTAFGKTPAAAGGGEEVVAVEQSRESETDGDQVLGGAPWYGRSGISAKSFISSGGRL